MKLMQAIENSRRMNTKLINPIEDNRRRNLVHVQSVLFHEDAVTLKVKAGESNIKDAVSKAVYHYLKCQKTDEDDA